MEYIELGKILIYEQPTKYIVKDNKYSNKYKTPVLTAGKTFILGYTNETENIFPKEKLPVIIFDDFTTATKFVDFPFKVKSSAMKILNPTEGINIKYVFYAMQKIKVNSDLHKRYWISKYSNIKIILPNIEKQNEIANKLDKVQEIIDIRKKQIEELNVLLKSKFVEMFQKHDFNNRVCIENVCSEMKIGPFGSALHKNEISSSGDVFVLGTDNAVDNEFKVYEKRYISNKKYQELIKYTVHPADIIISMMGTIGKTSIIPSNFGKAIISSHLCYLTPKASVISSDFLHYTLKYSDLIADQIEKQKKGAIMNGLNLKIIKSLEFDLPPLELQNQFAEFVKLIDKQKVEIQKSLEEIQKLQESLMNKFFG